MHVEARTYAVSHLADEPTVAAWEQHNADALIELSCRVPWGRPFRARERSLHLGGLRLARVEASAHAVERDAAMVGARPADALGVFAALRGEAVVELDGVRRVVHPGHVLICDLDRPLRRRFAAGLEELAIRLPRRAVAAVTDRADLTGPTEPLILDVAADPHARSLVALATRAVRGVDAGRPDEQTLVELVAVLAAGGRIALPAAHRAAARAFIEDHLADPSLGASETAGAIGISERHLSRLFADAGTSLPRHILARRLDLAHALLEEDTASRTVDVAARCGFTSPAHFSRAFARRFGTNAGDVRRAARRARIAPESPA